jgi:hypothetical protein
MDQQAYCYYELRLLMTILHFCVKVPNQSQSIFARRRSSENTNFNDVIPDNHFSSKDNESATH